MPSVSPKSILLSKVEKALPLAKALVKAVDVDKDGEVDLDEEVRRIGVRDQFVARGLVRLAGTYEVYGRDGAPTPQGMVRELDRAMRSLVKSDKNGDGKVDRAELAKTSKVARQLVAFSQAHAGKSVKDFLIKPYEKPGTKAWLQVAEKSYYDVERSGGGQPRFGTALIIKRGDLPAPIRAEYDKLRREAPKGVIEASDALVNGQTTYYIHVKADRRVDVIIVDPTGKRLAKGIATAPKVKPGESAWNAIWKFSWAETR